MSIIKFFPLILLLGCAGIPRQRPDQFTAQLSVDGGMLNRSQEICFSSDKKSYVKTHTFGVKNEYILEPTQEELDSLYEVFYTHNFASIREAREEGVHDRGGTSIYLDVGDKRYKKRNTGGFFIRGLSSGKYAAARKAIRQLASKKLNEMAGTITLRFDESLFAEDRIFKCTLDPQDFFSFSLNSEKDEVMNEVTIPILPGEHLFHLNMVPNTQPSYKRKSIAFDEIRQVVESTHSVITLSFREDHFALDIQ